MHFLKIFVNERLIWFFSQMDISLLKFLRACIFVASHHGNSMCYRVFLVIERLIWCFGKEGLSRFSAKENFTMYIWKIKYCRFENNNNKTLLNCIKLWQVGWMMWNWLVSGLAVGAAIVLYDGSPLIPHANHLWDLVDELG